MLGKAPNTIMITRITILLSISLTSSLLIRYGTVRIKGSKYFPNFYLSATQNPASLHFKASSLSTTRSAPKPKGGEEEALLQFFSSEEHRNQLLVGSGNMQITTLQKSFNTTRLLNRWKEELKFFKLDLAPEETNPKFVMLSVWTHFLVFTIIADAVLGVLLVPKRPLHTHTKTTFNFLPEYQFVLLEESFHADGPPPLVWLFNKLTGLDRTDQDSSHHSNHVFFRVWVEETSNCTIAFSSQSKADLSFNFPSFLLNLLPVSKDIIENQGNSALQKSMEKDVSPGLESFLKSYLQWLKKKRVSC